MPEKEPLYFKEFREIVMGRFEGMDAKFDAMDTKFEGLINDLARSTAQGFRETHERMDKVEDTMSGLKREMELIEAHIGRYDVRSTYIEDTFIKNYGRRIGDLEKAFLAA